MELERLIDLVSSQLLRCMDIRDLFIYSAQYVPENPTKILSLCPRLGGLDLKILGHCTGKKSN
jgi:hypothetical protein